MFLVLVIFEKDLKTPPKVVSSKEPLDFRVRREGLAVYFEKYNKIISSFHLG
uniref:Uncharacterized protein n=1 Tax=Rhizophora mucronata TaxID=61149 RepID=A0A2P2J622_RHIMU